MPKQKTKVKVKTITVARLYNTGDYEHVRYELSADVPKDSSACKVMQGLLAILHACSPKCPVSRNRMKDLQDRINLPADKQKHYYGLEGDSLDKAIETAKAELAELQIEYCKWTDARKTALAALDDVTDVEDTPF